MTQDQLRADLRRALARVHEESADPLLLAVERRFGRPAPTSMSDADARDRHLLLTVYLAVRRCFPDRAERLMRAILGIDDAPFDEATRSGIPSPLPAPDIGIVGSARHPSLVALAPSDPDVYGHTWCIEGSRVMAGRSRENDLRMHHATVSRRQFELARHGGRIWIADLFSTNGTRLNGRRLEPLVPVPLHHQDLVDAGRVVLRFLEAHLPAFREAPSP